MDLTLKSVSTFVEDQSWLRNPEHAVTSGHMIDVSTLTEADHYPNGYLTSGIVLAKVTAGGLLSNYDAGAVDGTETAVGILFKSVVVDTTDTTIDVGVTVMEAGFIIAANLPTQGALVDGDWDAAAATDLQGLVKDVI